MSDAMRQSAKPGPAVAAPPTTEAIVRAITALAHRLSELMIKETALVVAGRSREVAVLAQEKAELARAYAGRWGQLKADRAGFAELPLNVRDALQFQVGRLSVVAGENERALRLMQHATDRVLGLVTRTIRKQYTSGMGYGKGGAAPRRVAGLQGVALDRTL